MSRQIVYGPSTGRYLTTEIDWAACGTEKNYRHHLRRGEKPCEACAAANRRVVLDRRHRYRERQLPDDDPRHGTSAGYTVQGCRCDRCREWASAYHKEYRRRKKQGAA